MKKEIKDMIEVAEDIRHLSKSSCALTHKGINCIECGECSIYGREVFVQEYSCDFDCPLEECNDCSLNCYDSYAYFEDDISPEDIKRFRATDDKFLVEVN